MRAFRAGLLNSICLAVWEVFYGIILCDFVISRFVPDREKAQNLNSNSISALLVRRLKKVSMWTHSALDANLGQIGVQGRMRPHGYFF